jgi:transcriptional regulator with XRE-family HTH domain
MRQSKAEYRAEVGARIRRYRNAKGLSMSRLAQLVGAPQPRISEYERGVHLPSEPMVRAIANALGVLPAAILTDPTTRAALARDFASNPKPIRLGDICLDKVYAITGDDETPLDISVEYTHAPLKLHPKVAPVFSKLNDRARKLQKGAAYWNGPCARLVQIGEETSRQVATGAEQRGIVLRLAAVSWFEFKVLNSFLDERKVFPDEPGTTMRSLLANEEMLYNHPHDFTWCSFANTLTICIIPITTDGYGIIQRRSGSVSFHPRLLTTGIAENMHRWLDEAPRHDLWHRINPLMAAAQTADIVDAGYRPAAGNVPSPFLTALRGFAEELAPLQTVVESGRERLKFLNLIFDLEVFHSDLVGIIELPYARDEMLRLIEEHRGRDHSEALNFQFLALQRDDKATLETISATGDWVFNGLAAAITAIKYWEAKSKGRRKRSRSSKR